MENTGNNGFLGNIEIAGGIIILIWAVHFLNYLIPFDFRQFGIKPRHLSGLLGIFLSPFLHGGLKHIMGNSGALFVLLVVSLSLDRKLTMAALAIIITGGGAAVWLLGKPNTVHIGASGVIFGLIGFLLFTGIFQKRLKPVIFSLIVGFFYGSALFTLFVYMPGVSWSGHFWGFLSGVIAAWILRKRGRPEKGLLYQ